MDTALACIAATSLVALLSASSAHARAQDFIVPPDFPQLRPGLPATSNGTAGGAYCGPTSAADLLDWMHDHGFPEVESMGEDADSVTLSIFLLGVLMETDPDAGTTVENLVGGLQDYLDAVAPGDFDVGYLGRDCEGVVAQALGHDFAMIGLLFALGRISIARVGWYALPGGLRCKGHFVAMTGYEWLGGHDYRARFRDPAREVDTISTQDTSYQFLTLQDGDGVYRDQWASSWNWARAPQISNTCTSLARTGVQDGIVSIGGMRLFSPPLTGSFIFAYNRASGQSSSQAMAGSSTATSLASHPYLFDLYYCNPNDNQVFKTDLRTNLTSVFPVGFGLNQPRRLAFGANANLFVLQGNASAGFDLLAFKPDGSLIQKVTKPTQGAIAYQDLHDRVLWWTASSTTNQLARYDSDLDSAGASIQLPSGPLFVAPGYLAADARREIVYYNHQGSSAIFRFDLEHLSPLAPIAHSALVDPAEMAVDHRGHLYVVQGSFGPVLEFDVDGDLVTGSPAGNLSGANVLALGRSPRRPIVSQFGGADNDPLDEPFRDCNQNGIPDDQDIAEGRSQDEFLNDGIPDECQTLKPLRRN